MVDRLPFSRQIRYLLRQAVLYITAPFNFYWEFESWEDFQKRFIRSPAQLCYARETYRRKGFTSCRCPSIINSYNVIPQKAIGADSDQQSLEKCGPSKSRSFIRPALPENRCNWRHSWHYRPDRANERYGRRSIDQCGATRPLHWLLICSSSMKIGLTKNHLETHLLQQDAKAAAYLLYL